jgi:hypothetical protein
MAITPATLTLNIVFRPHAHAAIFAAIVTVQTFATAPLAMDAVR